MKKNSFFVLVLTAALCTMTFASTAQAAKLEGKVAKTAKGEFYCRGKSGGAIGIWPGDKGWGTLAPAKVGQKCWELMVIDGTTPKKGTISFEGTKLVREQLGTSAKAAEQEAEVNVIHPDAEKCPEGQKPPCNTFGLPALPAAPAEKTLKAPMTSTGKTISEKGVSSSK